MDRFILISGCSGGGKSSLLSELQRRRHFVVEEPGRRIVGEQVAERGIALPWVDLAAFAIKAIELSRADRRDAERHLGLVFFDRGLIDAASALEVATGFPALNSVATERYNQVVFLTPPWAEIYETDSERKHSFAEAVSEYDRLLLAFATLNYDIEILPFASVAERADFVLNRVLNVREV
jgi:predicted ATPase